MSTLLFTGHKTFFFLTDKEEVGKKRRKVLPYGGGDSGGGYFGGLPPGMGGGGNAGGGMFGAPGFQGFMGSPGIGGYQQAMDFGEISLNSSKNKFGNVLSAENRGHMRFLMISLFCAELDGSDDDSDDDDLGGGLRGRTAQHTFAPVASQASGPVRGRGARRMAPASGAPEESSSER